VQIIIPSSQIQYEAVAKQFFDRLRRGYNETTLSFRRKCTELNIL
jgi:hypothetical protein